MSDENYPTIDQLEYHEPMIVETRISKGGTFPLLDKSWDGLTQLTYHAGVVLSTSGIKVLIAQWPSSYECPTCTDSRAGFGNPSGSYVHKIVGMDQWLPQTLSFEGTEEHLYGLSCGAYIESKKHTKESS